MEDMKVFLVEDCDCEYRVFVHFEDALKYAIQQIEESNNDSETKMEMYKELVMSVANRDASVWGQGFSIDEFLWCWRIDLFAGEAK